MQVNNKIVANWLKIATDLQSQLVVSEEDKIKLSTQIAILTAENERLREVLKAIADDCEAYYPPSHGAIKYAARAALQLKEGEG